MQGQAICKDCGNGTLNNLTNEQFVLNFDEYDNGFITCVVCGSTHIGGQLEVISSSHQKN